MYAPDQQTSKQAAAYGYGSGIIDRQIDAALGARLPPPAPISALAEAIDNMDRSIGEVMAMLDTLAARLNPILRPVPAGVGGGNDKTMVSASPVVETINRQRGRILAMQNQIADLLDRVEV